MKKLIIIGAGGFGREVAWVVERINRVSSCWELVGFCDDAAEKQKGLCGGYPLLGTVETAMLSGIAFFFCALGSNRARQAMTERAIALGLKAVTVVDPTAVIAPDVEIGAGSYTGIGSVVSTGTRLGNGVIVNHQVCVGHDVGVDDFAQLCPGVKVSGGCKIGEGALLGTNAGTIPLKKIGAWSTVGAGMTALRDVADGASVIRIAAREVSGPISI